MNDPALFYTRTRLSASKDSNEESVLVVAPPLPAAAVVADFADGLERGSEPTQDRSPLSGGGLDR